MDYTFVVVLAISLFAIFVAWLLLNNEKYTQSANFESGGNLMLMNSNGDIVFQPVSDIDTAINSTAASLNTDMSNDFNNFRISSNSLYAPVGNYAYKTIVPPAYQPAGAYQSAGNYVKYSDKIGLQSYQSPTTDYFGRYDDRGGWYGGSGASQAAAVWSIVPPPFTV